MYEIIKADNFSSQSFSTVGLFARREAKWNRELLEYKQERGKDSLTDKLNGLFTSVFMIIIIIIIIIIMTLIKYIHWVALHLDYATIFTILTKKDL